MAQAKTKFFTALLGASVLMVSQAQGQPICDRIECMVFTPQHASIDSAKEMLPLCQKEIAQGRPGMCTGYIIAVALEMAAHREARGCLPGYFGEYDEMLRAVVPGIAREVQGNRDVHMRVATEDALAKWARAKFCKE
jgi:hypothetical protein